MATCYFTAFQDNAIEQLNPATHVVTSFPIPTAGIGPQFITTGPDGNLYFTTSNANVIEQLNPTTRVFKTFFIPTANSGASGITSGPDNSLWFIESAANKIGQLNPATGVFTELPIPNHHRRHLHDHDRSRRQSLLHRTRLEQHRAVQPDHPCLPVAADPGGQ